VPAPKHSWIKSGLHFCGSCCITVSCWGLWIVLGTLLVVLTYVALARELPVPGFVLRQAEARLAESGLILKFGRASLDPSGQVLLENVQLRNRQFEDPLLECRLLYIRRSFWSILSGRVEPDEISIEGAALRLPAMFSPSGTSQYIVSDLSAEVQQGDHVWHVVQFSGRVGPVRISLSGDIPFSGRSRGARAFSLDDLTAGYLRTARQFAPELQRLNALDDPSLEVLLETDSRRGLLASVRLTATALQLGPDQPLQLGPFIATTQARLDGAGSRPVELYVATRSVKWQDSSAHQVRALLKAEFLPDKLRGGAHELSVAAGSVHHLGESAEGPCLRVDLAAWPDLRTVAATQIEGQFLAAEIEANLRDQSARIQAKGRVSDELITRVLRQHTPRAAPYFEFGDPIAFTAEAEIGPGWHFKQLSSRVDARRLNSHNVHITSARGRIDIVGHDFLAHDAVVTMGDNVARGSYWMNFSTTDYRMLLEGRLQPVAISGWFQGDWWPVFWNRYFAFPERLPVAEVDIQGRWKDPTLSNNFVRARAEHASIWGGDFEEAEATLFIRPTFVHGLASSGVRAGGKERLGGTFKRVGIPNTRETAKFEFDFTTNANTAMLGRMLEGRADEVLATLQFTRPPDVHAWGAIEQGVPDYRFIGEVKDPVRYYGFPLDTAHVEGHVQGNSVQLDDIQYAAAGGHGAGKASLTGPPTARRLGFDLFLNKANLSQTIRAVQEYDAYRTGTKSTSTGGKFAQQAANSVLDIALSAQGDPADLASFKGAGNASLTGAELGEIHLFGLLSQVLSGLSLSFSSLKLDAARTSFTMQNGALLFPDLKVTGSSALIDGRGRYVFATNSLDFAARFRPYEAPGSLLAAAVSLVLNPLTSILELKLTGQLADPKWSVVVSSGSDPSKVTTPPPQPVTESNPATK
jgi:hypothetical protein